MLGSDYGNLCVPSNIVRLRRCAFCNHEGMQDRRDGIECMTSRNSSRGTRSWKAGIYELEAGELTMEGSRETEASTHRGSDTVVDMV